MEKKMCVVGAGTMGWSIAQVFASAGYGVVLCDQGLALAQMGKDAMAASLAKEVGRGRMDKTEADAIISRVMPAELTSTAGCILTVEAICEDMAAKKAIFRALETILPEEAVFATNTSSLSITELASCLKNPSRLVGMHFFNPATTMKLVEVISGVHSDSGVLDRIIEIAREIGKVPVQVSESPGFVVNRILTPMINEAIALLAEGVASAEDIDTAMKLGANHPMGPLALGDLVGLDICLAVMEILHHETGDDKYRPHPLLRKMVRAGMLGRKTKKGFYVYQ